MRNESRIFYNKDIIPMTEEELWKQVMFRLVSQNKEPMHVYLFYRRYTTAGQWLDRRCVALDPTFPDWQIVLDPCLVGYKTLIEEFPELKSLEILYI